VDECPVEAIHLLDQRAVIDNALCTACEACFEACPNDAITLAPILEPKVSIMTLPAGESHPVIFSDQAALPVPAATSLGLVQIAGAALAFIGREAAPSLIDVLISSLERKIAGQKTTVNTPLSSSSYVLSTQNRGKRTHVRNRGGQYRIRNQKGRR
jgi:ferredoxin